MHDDPRRNAFEILYAEHAAPVYRFALRICGNREDAEDLAAEALVQAYRKWAEYRGESSPRTWLCAIVLNQWRMQKRKGKVAQDRLDTISEVASTFRFQDHELAEAICGLPDPLREAFLLVKGEGMTHAEAARAVRVPIGTMYFRVHSAVYRLRLALGPAPSVAAVSPEVPCSHEM